MTHHLLWLAAIPAILTLWRALALVPHVLQWLDDNKPE